MSKKSPTAELAEFFLVGIVIVAMLMTMIEDQLIGVALSFTMLSYVLASEISRPAGTEVRKLSVALALAAMLTGFGSLAMMVAGL